MVYDFEILGNLKKGKKFVERVEKKKFLFSFVISYTQTSEIPGITIAGANPKILKFTPPADAEYLHYGYCKSIKNIPMTPDGKPTPAILTKIALEAASIPHIVINAGSQISPQLPHYETKLEPGKNITQERALESSSVIQAVDYGRIIARTMASMTDCLIIGESIPGGTTTALAVLRGLGIDAKHQRTFDVVNTERDRSSPHLSWAVEHHKPLVRNNLRNRCRRSRHRQNHEHRDYWHQQQSR